MEPPMPEPLLRVHVDGTSACAQALAALVRRGASDDATVEPAVRAILDAVRARGDAAVLSFAERFDRRRPPSLLVRDYQGAAALARLERPAREALELAAARIRAFHERERDAGFRYQADGVELGLRVRPVRRAGVYAPGGKARYPSSVLMSAVPASVAGVGEILLATPLAGDASDDMMFAAAHLAGVTAVVDCGGAHAIAAMAYGTESVPKVDKIVGPGNLYVACAKRLVFGAVSIDAIAGPSEILVCADDDASPRHVAADLLSQAEHDEAAYPLLACRSERFARAVEGELARQLGTLPRAAIARASLHTHGDAFVVASAQRMAEVADTLAAEHVSVQVADPEAMADQIGAAGAIFLGPLTPEAAGDYLAGPSHVLPTGGSVRFGSPLGVYDFVSRSSLLRYSPQALAAHAGAICALARLEGLEGHARAVEARLTAARAGSA
jgi:histidinol dehydrogenase